jgi:dihydroorotate dehydrogenase electron transfer subunit
MVSKQIKVVVDSVSKIKEDIFLLSFSCPYVAQKAVPGNFLHVKIPGTILRRPLSVHNVKGDKIYILFKIRGRGTKILSQYKKGDALDIIGPLGKGFDISHQSSVVGHQNKKEGVTNILVAGGIGVAPLLFLAQKLKSDDGRRMTDDRRRDTILLGVGSKKDILCEEEFKKRDFKVNIATEDGSKGTKGTVIDLLKNIRTTDDGRRTTNIYACGPKEMFYAMNKILKKYPNVNCQVSFEQFMGCGVGVCCGCVIATKDGYKKVCKDGPVFNLKDIE